MKKQRRVDWEEWAARLFLAVYAVICAGISVLPVLALLKYLRR